jgi:hypothetical protein
MICGSSDKENLNSTRYTKNRLISQIKDGFKKTYIAPLVFVEIKTKVEIHNVIVT